LDENAAGNESTMTVFAAYSDDILKYRNVLAAMLSVLEMKA